MGDCNNPGVSGVAVAGRTRHILVVDDSDTVRRSLRANLEYNGYAVCEAVQGLEAIEKAKKFKPDLIILDLVMPVMNGVEAASVLKRMLPDVPLILLSIYGDKLGKTTYGENFGKSLTPAFGIKAVLSKADGIKPLLQCVKTLLP
jgi:CheY-like chemotaxis protein